MKERRSDISINEGFSRSIKIPCDEEYISGDWSMPPKALGIVIFAHGSGSSRHSTRNKEVARYLGTRGIGTLLLDLLTPSEEQKDIVTRSFRFDIPFLARRLVIATKWLQSSHEANGIPVGYFGASTGAAAALVASTRLHDAITAIVSRGGRPDLADKALENVTSPTLLIVGGSDPEVVELNRTAMNQMSCKGELVVIPGATHLFEEPGALDKVAVLSADWFSEHFSGVARPHFEVRNTWGKERRHVSP